MKSMLVALGAVGIAASGLVAAPAANAATYTPTCPASDTNESITGDSHTFNVVHDGQNGCTQLRWTAGAGITADDVSVNNGTISPGSWNTVVTPPNNSAVSFLYTGSATGTVTITFDDGMLAGWDRNSVYVITVGAAPSPSPAPSAPSAPSDSTGSSGAESGPAAVVQQFGMPASGTCDDAQPDGLNWAGVASGGWSTVWGEWMHDGVGGWACSRTLSYSSSQATWGVN